MIMKMENRQKTCRFCFEKCDNFEAIEVTREMLEKLLLKINVSVIEEPVMCTKCAETVKNIFDFKTTCLCTRDYILSFVKTNDIVKVDVRDVYLSKNVNENAIDIFVDYNVCNFCMALLKSSSFILLDNKEEGVILKKMLDKCIPELDISVTKEPAICATCHGSLQNYYSFLMNYFALEEKYCKTTGIKSMVQIQLNDVRKLTDDMCQEVDSKVDLIKIESKICTEIKNEEMENFMEDQKLNSVQELTLKNILSNDEDDKNINMIKIKQKFYEEDYKNENFIDMNDKKFLSCNNEEIELKTDQHDSFQNDVLPQPEVNAKSREKCLKPHPARNLSNTSLYWSETGIMYQCGTCEFQTTSKRDLQSHELTHENSSGKTMYHCDICSFRTKYKRSLPSHMLTHKNPSEITMYQCESCSYQTKYKRCLRSHSLSHKNPSEVTTYQCEICSFQTKYKNSLDYHMSIHKPPSEITKYQCESCPFQTKYRNSIQIHVQTHKNPSEVTKYQCDFCSFQTKHKFYLKNHMLSHKKLSEVTQYQCESCSFTTISKCNLRKHMFTHRNPSDVTMYNCEICSFQTRYKKNVDRHMLVHKKSQE